MTVFVEVNGVAEPEDEEAYGDDSADYDDPGSIFDAGGIAFLFSCLDRLGGRLLSFHNCF